MDDSIDSFDESFAGVGALLQELRKVFSEFTKEHTNIEDTVKTVMKYISHAIKDILDSFNECSLEAMKSYFNIEIAIPNLAISINDYDHVPQAPPKEKSVKEIAIENLKYNIDRYKNSKIFNSATRVITYLAKEFTISFIMYWIFKALGMQ